MVAETGLNPGVGRDGCSRVVEGVLTAVVRVVEGVVGMVEVQGWMAVLALSVVFMAGWCVGATEHRRERQRRGERSA
jgi:hypothetical protein